MILVGYLAMSLVGVTLGIIGAGGSILTVPILVYLFRYDAAAASYYSMGIVGVSALVALPNYWRQGRVDLKTVIKFVPASMVGVFLTRNIILPMIPEQILSSEYFTLTKNQMILSLFAVLMIMASRSMLSRKSLEHSKPLVKRGLLTSLRSVAIAFFVGGVTGIVGAGGGFLIIPALINLLGLDITTAVGSSLVIIAINTLWGFLSGLSSAQIPWSDLTTMTLVTTACAAVSSKFSKKIPQESLKKAFGWFILVMGTFILSQQLLLK